jgi:ribosome maturation factor RimP
MASQVPLEVSEPIAAAAQDAGVEVYHAALSGRALRVQVESAAGASVRTCSDFARALAVRLDAAGFLHGQYVLEVSTPGVERSLYQPGDYVKALNRQVRVLASDGLHEGRLEAAGPAGITIRTEVGTAPATFECAYAEIREARIRVSDSELFARTATGPRSPAERNQ